MLDEQEYLKEMAVDYNRNGAESIMVQYESNMFYI